MFGGSSRSVNQPNADGSQNVYCYNCRDFIGKSFVRVHRALCYLCQASEDGRQLTEEQINQYRLSKGARADVTALNLPEPVVNAQGFKKKKFRFGGMVGEAFQALGRFMQAEKTEEQVHVNTNSPSVKISQAKKRPRLFGNIGIEDKVPKGTVLGTMEEVDKKGQE